MKYLFLEIFKKIMEMILRSIEMNNLCSTTFLYFYVRVDSMTWKSCNPLQIFFDLIYKGHFYSQFKVSSLSKLSTIPFEKNLDFLYKSK